MKLHLLHLDDALLTQPDFMARCERESARAIEATQEGSLIRLWGKNAKLDTLAAKLNDGFAASGDEPKLCFMGSGDFHHVSALLIEETLAKQTDPITVIHFDNHPDWVRFNGGMHCGSWVNRASAHPMVERVVTIGVASGDLTNPDWKGASLNLLRDGALELFPYSRQTSRVRHAYGAGASHTQLAKNIQWQTIAQMGEEMFTDFLLTRIPTKSVYVTIDKDVLTRDDAETNWDQGEMRLDYLLALLTAIGKQHTIIGADVTGDYSLPHYTGSRLARFKKRAEIYLDQPQHKRDARAAAALNTASNVAILDTLQKVMA